MKNNPLSLVMIQPQPLPGSYLNNGESLNSILSSVLEEASMIVEQGFDGFILQNMHDGPIKQQARIETISYMTILGRELKVHFPDKVLGILINWDGVASLAVADAVGADFARVEYLYTGVSVGTTGFMEGQCIEILELKKRLNSKVKIFADVQEVNSNYLLPRPKEVEAISIVTRAHADGLFMSGKSVEESLNLIRKVREKLPNTPILLGGGATGENIYELLNEYDGVSVATWIKNGDMRNPIDPERSNKFIKEAKRASVDRQKSVNSI